MGIDPPQSMLDIVIHGRRARVFRAGLGVAKLYFAVIGGGLAYALGTDLAWPFWLKWTVVLAVFALGVAWFVFTLCRITASAGNLTLLLPLHEVVIPLSEITKIRVSEVGVNAATVYLFRRNRRLPLRVDFVAPQTSAGSFADTVRALKEFAGTISRNGVRGDRDT
jgi:hypothetical protein